MSEVTEFKYKDIELFKTDNLGSGSYGVVCKAKCNNLMCAAKIIYPILFESTTNSLKSLPGSHLTPVQRFEQECEFLRQIHHPCIVQYLQTYRDPETGSSILIMELMDNNLTHFLQNSPTIVPSGQRSLILACLCSWMVMAPALSAPGLCLSCPQRQSMNPLFTHRSWTASHWAVVWYRWPLKYGRIPNQGTIVLYCCFDGW